MELAKWEARCPYCHEIFNTNFKRYSESKKHTPILINIRQETPILRFCCYQHKLLWIYKQQKRSWMK